MAGQVLVSEATRRLVSADLVSLGEHRLKDLLQAEQSSQSSFAAASNSSKSGTSASS